MSAYSKRPSIHLWTYNHPYYGIVDQTDFIVAIFKQNGYDISFGRHPCKHKLNIVIENFSVFTSRKLIEFCRITKKRVVIIMTEHLDFDLTNNQIRMHGSLLDVENDYMPNSVQKSRIRFFLDCLPYIHGLFVLGDLPELRNFDKVLPGVGVKRLAFPKLDFIEVKNPTVPLLKNNLLFTGNPTKYREHILDVLNQRLFQVAYPQKFVSKKRREQLILSSRVLLNIPQRKDWHWLSLMRIISGLRLGRGVISIGTQDTSNIACCCPQLDINSKDMDGQLRCKIDSWYFFYVEAYDAYMSMVNQFKMLHIFPHQMLDWWAIMDKL